MNLLDRALLPAFDSATQYPSIPTFHELGDRGRLTDTVSAVFRDDMVATEKVDGTNVRIVLLPEAAGFVIGSRKELLTASGDLISNPALGIVDAVRSTAERLVPLSQPDRLVVVFGEVYGGKVGSGAKQYTSTGAVGFRIFDVASLDTAVLDGRPDEISAWREARGQTFLHADALSGVVEQFDLVPVPALRATPPPTSVGEAAAWLEQVAPRSLAVLDEASGRPEGVVVRTPDRQQIAKLRFEDYRRTLR